MPLPSSSVRSPVTVEAPQDIRRPSNDWTLSFRLVTNLFSNGFHEAQLNFQIGLTSPLNDQHATKGGACVISSSHIEVYSSRLRFQAALGTKLPLRTGGG